MRVGVPEYHKGYKMILMSDRWVSVYACVGTNQEGQKYYTWKSDHPDRRHAIEAIDRIS